MERMEFAMDRNALTFNHGDSICFDQTHPHSTMRAIGKRLAKLICVFMRNIPRGAA